jgi:acetyltransferase-like isoleucine patch superfamily enzyme
MKITELTNRPDRVIDLGIASLDYIRAFIVYLTYKKKFKRIGTNFKLRGTSGLTLGSNVRVGRFCWIECVLKYNSLLYNPSLIIGSNAACSDLVHISCVSEIRIGEGTLIGSKVYIGDHSHGFQRRISSDPCRNSITLDLQDIAPIEIGRSCWIGDGAVILAGTKIPPYSVIGANSVVKGQFTNSGLIAGIPAREVKIFDSE